LLVLAVVSPALVGLLAFFDTDVVHSHADLAHVEFGVPFDWVSQSQGFGPIVGVKSKEDPRVYPYEAGFGSPEDYSFTVSAADFALDVLIVTVLLTGFLVWFDRARASAAASEEHHKAPAR
jgi:hypothetical protein